MLYFCMIRFADFFIPDLMRHSIVTALVALTTVQAQSTTQGLEEADVYVLSGQSNMMGAGTTEDGLPAHLQTQQADIYFVDLTNMAGTFMNLDVPNATRYGDPWPPPPIGFGPDVTFARSVADSTKRRVFIYKWALGGQNLDVNFLRKGGLYDWMIQNKGKIEKDLRTRFNASPRYRGFFWMQGESDANDTMAPKYAANLAELMQRVRRDFGASIPVHLGRLSTFTNHPNWMAVRAAQVAFAEADSNAHWIDTDSFEVFPKDRIHFNNNGAMSLGHAFAQSYLKTFQRTEAYRQTFAPVSVDTARWFSYAATGNTHGLTNREDTTAEDQHSLRLSLQTDGSWYAGCGIENNTAVPFTAANLAQFTLAGRIKVASPATDTGSEQVLLTIKTAENQTLLYTISPTEGQWLDFNIPLSSFINKDFDFTAPKWQILVAPTSSTAWGSGSATLDIDHIDLAQQTVAAKQ
jgi:hypothetical protein